jgi:hypothetical protein
MQFQQYVHKKGFHWLTLLETVKQFELKSHEGQRSRNAGRLRGFFFGENGNIVFSR